jgi:uncharacterized protein (TIGR02996 family)
VTDQALLRAIVENPDEDTPRLMFADWLDEHDDPTRAEFIRLQCELARLDTDGSDSHAVYEFLRDRDYVTRPAADWPRIDGGIHRRVELTTRLDDLVKQHGAEWAPHLPKKAKARWDGFHRGFAHRVELNDVRKVAAVAEQLRRSAPAVTLVCREFTSDFVDELANAGLLGWITGLELRGGVTEGLRTFGHRPEAAGVRSLTVYYGTSFEITSALADSPHWTGLRSLDLSASTLASEDAEALFRAPQLRTQKRLAVRGQFWAPDAAHALAAGGFTELTSLQLTQCNLGDDAAEVLAACPALARLRTLDLAHNALTGTGVTALLSSPHLANVAFLGLEANPCSGVDAERLAATAPAGLRLFHCHGCRFRTSDVRALARCPRLRTLWYLDLDDNDLGPSAVSELVRGFKDFCPPIIWMTHNRIDDRGAERLAKWKAAQALDVLHLRYNAITDAGIQTMLASPYLANLESLGVDTKDADLHARLLHRFRHHDLTYI